MADLIVYTMKLVDMVTPSLSKINKAIGETVNQKKRLGRELQSVGKGITSVGSALLPMSAAIVGAGVMAGKAFTSFDATMTMAGVKAGATAQEVEKLRATAKQLGADFPISASAAAKAMENLAASGYSAKQIIGTMPAIVTSSVASAESLEDVSATITNALNVWNLKQGDVAKNASHVGDVIAMASNKSKLALGDFALAMQYAGAPAASLGVGLEELTTAMAVMRDGGIEASAVGTSLRSTLSRLASPTGDVADALNQLGVKTTDANGKFLGLTNILAQMRKSMDGMSNSQKVALAQTIAGTNGYSGLLMLLNKNTDAYKDLQTAITNSDGAAKKAADTMSRTFQGSIENLKSKLEALAIDTFEAMKPRIQSFVDGLAGVFEMLNKLSPGVKSFIITLAGAVVGFTATCFVVGKLITLGGSLMLTLSNIQKVLEGGTIANKALQYSVTGVSRSYQFLRANAVKAMAVIRAEGALNLARQGFMGLGRSIMTAARASLAFAMTPLGVAIAGIALGAYLLYKNWDKVAPIVVGLWNKIKSVFSNVMQSFKPHIQTALNAIKPLITLGKNLAKVIMIVLGGAIKVACALFDVFSGILTGTLIASLHVFAGAVDAVFTFVGKMIGTVVNMILDVFAGIIDFITGVFTGNWEKAWQGVVEIFRGIFTGILGTCEAVLGGIKSLINSIIGGINSIEIDIPSWVPVYGGKHFGPLGIPTLYVGTENWAGGPAMIHDKGAEIVDLPSGSRVIPHDKSMQQAFNAGKNAGGLGGIVVNFNNVSINNGDTDVKELARRVASEIYYEVKKHSVNMKEGAV